MFSGNTSQVSDGRLYVEDVFSTWLYTGTGAAQTITNGIDLAGKGGLVWTKSRSNAIQHNLIDTVRGGDNGLSSSTTAASTTGWGTTFSSTGFAAGAGTYNTINNYTYASWTFREAPKFFDVVTWTGTGANRTIAHNLGVAPGCIIVKQTSGTSNWRVYHRGMTSAAYTMQLNQTNAESSQPSMWNSTAPTSTEFSVGTDPSVNDTGQTYVAYLYAHDTSSTGLIQCGSFTADGSGNVSNQNLGWEPQWILLKTSSSTEGWILADNMRGWSYNSTQGLFANTSGAEFSNSPIVIPTANGFVGQNGQLSASQTYIYIAIRRGPMKTPTLGTSVFAPVLYTGTSAAGTISGASFPPDLVIPETRNNANNRSWFDRLRGRLAIIQTDNTNAEIAAPSNSSTSISSFNMNGVSVGTDAYAAINQSGYTYVNYFLGRAPGFFDVVCYTGTGVDLAQSHNLGVTPELLILKRRNTTGNWEVAVVNSATTYRTGDGPTTSFRLNGTNGWGTTDFSISAYFNSTTFTPSLWWGDNTASGGTYVAYLFASCPGVSKVGSYTGNGSSQTINCGFAAGARFVLIKRTDSTGAWYVWDTARGIVAGNDPHLSLNTTAAEVTSNDTIDTDSSGFVVNQVAATNVNVSSATYIYLAIA